MNLFDQTYIIPRDQRETVGMPAAWLSPMITRMHDAGAYLSARRARARELRELYRFSDRELWDVGLSRSDIVAMEKGIYRRD